MKKGFWKRYKEAHNLFGLLVMFPSSILISVPLFWIEEKIKNCKL